MKAMLVRWHQQLTLTSYQNLQMASHHFLLLRNGSSVSHTVGFTWRPKHYIALFLLFNLRYKEFLQKKKFVIRLIKNLKRWAVIPLWMNRTLITPPPTTNCSYRVSQRLHLMLSDSWASSSFEADLQLALEESGLISLQVHCLKQSQKTKTTQWNNAFLCRGMMMTKCTELW